MYANDIGLLAICENWNVVGYNVLVGGSFGVTPSAKKTFPAVALPMCYIEAERVVDLCIAIVKVQRDFGNRADRKVARMKYLIHDWGLDRFRARSKSTSATRWRRCGRSASTASTTAWAGTSRATATGSTA